MSTHQIHVFISHSWAYSRHYTTHTNWIFGQTWRVGQASLDLRNYSVPSTNPILNARTDKALREGIYRQICRSHVIVIPAGMYSHHSKWIGKEIDGAATYGKPILAVDLRGALRTASIVERASSKCVAWNSNSYQVPRSLTQGRGFPSRS